MRFKDEIRALKILRISGQEIAGLARKLNPKIQGWLNYYGRFMPWAIKSTLQWLERLLVRWAMRKCKKLRRRPSKAWKWLRAVRAELPELFAHWKLMYPTAV